MNTKKTLSLASALLLGLALSGAVLAAETATSTEPAQQKSCCRHDGNAAKTAGAHCSTHGKASQDGWCESCCPSCCKTCCDDGTKSAKTDAGKGSCAKGACDKGAREGAGRK